MRRETAQGAGITTQTTVKMVNRQPRKYELEERTECILCPKSEYQTQDLHAGNEKFELKKKTRQINPLITRVIRKY
jgi:hypothetical protein